MNHLSTAFFLVAIVGSSAGAIQAPPPVRLEPVPVVEGGVCAGPLWVRLDPGETTQAQRFRSGHAAYYFSDPGNWSWTINIGTTPRPTAGRITAVGNLRFQPVTERMLGETNPGFAALPPDGRQIAIHGTWIAASGQALTFLDRMRAGSDRPAVCIGSDGE